MSTYGGRPEDRHGEPSDPWGQPDRPDGGYGGGYGDGGYGDGGYGTGYGQPSYGGTGYTGAQYGGDYGTDYRDGQSAGYGSDPDPEQPERNSTRLLVTIVAVLAVLFVAGAATAYFVTRSDNGKPSAVATTATGGPSGEAAAGGEQTPASDQTGTPAPEASAEARFAAAGQCLVNDGTGAQPAMRIVACGAGTYQVLARFDGTIDYASKCRTVKGYQFHYYFDAELNSLDYVLCLKKR